MQFRIGVNLGDVIAEDDNLYGTGVNVAVRLEQLATRAESISLRPPMIRFVKFSRFRSRMSANAV